MQPTIGVKHVDFQYYLHPLQQRPLILCDNALADPM